VGSPDLDEPSLLGVRGDAAGEAKLAALLQANFRSVWRALRRFGVPEASADDAAQEVFIIASRKLDAIEPGRERQFLHAVALRVAANARRARNVRPESAESPTIERSLALHPSPEALLDRKQARQALDRVLDAMTEDLRTAFVLFELEGYSGPEVAEMLEIPLGTATSRLRRARESFREGVAKIRRTLRDKGEP
jgi:RNA polymerase sigma-70 factor, ECF subfamily